MLVDVKFTRLRISGFKSFADATELAIEPGLTGIVGPNGCGKSNVVEALRWAMGESSAKGLRSDIMDDVIFSGNALRPAFDLAEVSLQLEGPFDGVAAEFDELHVARRLNRQGGSHYRMNGRETRARDLLLIFADAGSGSRSPAIIGQGQIGSIVDCKATDRRRLLEDQAGIGGLHDRRREAELRLAATEKNLERLLDALEVHDQRLLELAKQAKQAARYSKLAKEIREIEWQLVVMRYRLAQDELAVHTDQLAQRRSAEQALAGQLDARKAEIKALMVALQSRQSLLPPLSAEAASLREKFETKRLERDHVQALAVDLAARLEQTNLDLERERADRASLIATGSDHEREEASLHAEASALQSQQLETRENVERLGRELAQIDGRERDLSNQIAAKSDRLSHVQADLADLAAQAAHLAERRHALGDDTRGAAAQIEQRLTVIEHELGQCEQKIDTAMAARRLRHGELTASEAAFDDAKAARDAGKLALDRANDQHLALARAAKTNDQQRRHGAAKQRKLEADLAQNRQQMAAIDLPALQAQADTQARALKVAQEELAKARQARDDCRARAASLHERLRQVQGQTSSLETEINTLRSALPDMADRPVADRLAIDSGNRDAMAAAFGEAMLASDDAGQDFYWRDAGAAKDAADLPAGVMSLAGFAGSDDPLQRRLARTGMVDAGTADRLQAELQPGQQLVSPDGGLWRWDGYVQKPSTTNRLQQILDHRTRLAAAEAELAHATKEAAELEPKLSASQQALATAEQAHRDRAAAIENCQKQAAASAQTLAQAQAELQGLEKLHEALTGQARLLADELMQLETQEAEQAKLDALQASTAAARDGLTAAEQTLNSMAKARQSLSDDLLELDREVEASSAARKALLEERAQKQAKLDDMRQRSAEFDRQLSALDQAAASLAEREVQAKLAADQLAAALAAQNQQHKAVLAERAEQRQIYQAAQMAEQTARERLNTIANRLDAITDERERNAVLTVRIAEREHELAQRCQNLAVERERNAGKLKAAEAALAGLHDGKLAEIEARLTELTEEIAGQEAALRDLETQRDRLEQELATAREAVAVTRADVARADSQYNAQKTALKELLAEPQAAETLALQEEQAEFLTDMAISVASIEAKEQALARAKQARERLGAVNLRAEMEMNELQAEIDAQRQEEQEVRSAISKLQQAIATLNREGRERLVATFEEVDGHFRTIFQRLFGGGRAHLRLTNLDDPFAAGLELDAMPPGKKLQSLKLLSGGEKSLASLALIMALFLTRPSPLCILDEVDAALDDVNVERFTTLLRDMASTTDTRFLVVTHHPHTMAVMDRLYGVTMQERGVSKLVSVALNQAIDMRESA